MNRHLISLRQQLVERGSFWALCLLLVLTFGLGGGSRADISSLIWLRPVTLLLMGYGLCTLTWAHVRAHRFLLGMAGGVVGLVLLHLVPLPPAIWSTLPGRELVAEIDRVTGLGAIWRPISLVPTATWNAFYALMVPLAILILGVQLDRDARWMLLPLIIVLGLISGLLGVLQIGGSADGPLYFYQVTNNGSAVGLFANRNHQAVLLAILFPALAVFASTRLRSPVDAHVRAAVAMAAGIFLVPLILVTGSRAGLLAAVLGLLGALFLYQPPKRPGGAASLARRGVIVLAVISALVVGMSLLTITLGRAEAYERLIGQLAEEEGRFKIWGPVLDITWKYFPWGSGIGSFIEVYQVDEPQALLSTIYFNHAHNDWLELLLTGGLPACLLLGAALVAVAWTAIRLRVSAHYNARDRLMAWLGMLILILLAVASVGDYPLRVPSLASLFVVATLWMSAAKPICSAREII